MACEMARVAQPQRPLPRGLLVPGGGSQVRLERYRGSVVGWSTKRQKYLIDALTQRAIRHNKERDFG